MNSIDEIEQRLQELGLEVIERYDSENDYEPYTAFGISDTILYCVGNMYRLSSWVDCGKGTGRFTDLYWPKDFTVKCDGLNNRILLKSSQLPESNSVIDWKQLSVVLNRLSKSG